MDVAVVSRAEVMDFSIVSYYKHLVKLQLCIQKECTAPGEYLRDILAYVEAAIPLDKELTDMCKALERGNVNDVLQRSQVFADSICNWFFASNPTVMVVSPGSHQPDLTDKINTMKRYVKSSNPLIGLLSVFKTVQTTRSSRLSVTNNGDALIAIGATLSAGFYLLEHGLPRAEPLESRPKEAEKKKAGKKEEKEPGRSRENDKPTLRGKVVSPRGKRDEGQDSSVDREKEKEKEQKEKEQQREKEQKEKERKEKEQKEKDQREKEAAEQKAREEERRQKERQQKEKEEKERLQKEKEEGERLQKEKEEREKQQKEKEEKERIQKEKEEKERLQREKEERERQQQKEREERLRQEEEERRAAAKSSAFPSSPASSSPIVSSPASAASAFGAPAPSGPIPIIARSVPDDDVGTPSLNPASLIALIEKESAQRNPAAPSPSAFASSSPLLSSPTPKPHHPPAKPPPPITGGAGREPLLSSSGDLKKGGAWLAARTPAAETAIPRTPSTSNPIATVRAKFAYSGKQDDELSFTAHAIITVFEKKPSGWWDGETGGRRGLFPSNYVEELSSKRCRALYNYAAREPDELTIAKDDVISILFKQPNGWWRGELGGRVGVFPANYVTEL